jgi:hypothetical protein
MRAPEIPDSPPPPPPVLIIPSAFCLVALPPCSLLEGAPGADGVSPFPGGLLCFHKGP